jgi:hypothetical protein
MVLLVMVKRVLGVEKMVWRAKQALCRLGLILGLYQAGFWPLSDAQKWWTVRAMCKPTYNKPIEQIAKKTQV